MHERAKHSEVLAFRAIFGVLREVVDSESHTATQFYVLVVS
jgi:hypothetical protein